MNNKMINLWKIAYRNCRFYGFIKNITWFIYALLGVAEVIALQRFYSAVTENSRDIRTIIGRIVILGLVFMMSNIFLTITNVINEDTSFVMMKNIGDELQNKIKQYECDEYEDTAFLNKVNQANEGIENASFLLNVISMVIFYHVPYLVAMSIYLAVHNGWLIVVLLFISVPIIIAQIVKFREYENVAEPLARCERVIKEYKEYVFDLKYFKETRMRGAFSYFERLLTNKINEESKIKRNTSFRASVFSSIMQSISVVCYVMIIVLLIYFVRKGNLEVAGFYAILTSMTSMISIFEGLFGFYLGQISEQAGNILYLTQFLATGSTKEEAGEEIGNVKKIELKSVSFRYPAVEEYALRDVSCTFQKREIVAIVGENGAGKSTFLKLLMGLYHTYEGEIFYNDKNIKDASIDKIREKNTVVFQKYQKYKENLANNIFLDGNISYDRLDELVKQVDMSQQVKNWESGYETCLSKEFGGIDLSGGQWQRIAIARGMNKNVDIVCLDEPTSAIDPMEENSLYTLFQKISKDKFSFIVTHRLGLCKIANRILVIDEGKIMEDGSHEELLEKKGKYYEMYMKQSELY